ncbi:Outer membrane efflux protein [Pseudobythopirellula maris]|uniref:Outer membrane efflux protein n=1 Tax=Pseudobythopirellula maris TaxID=2527991 RepID=A0A5C5ZRK3_9BACT|nr:TolC family protein [Pseudobythopirellula maris]TWT89715.1 Outer membrane efflux protein [Pseudobythopirellula maris]
MPARPLAPLSALLAIALCWGVGLECLGAESLVSAWSEAIAKNQSLEASHYSAEAARHEALAAAAERATTLSTRQGYTARSDTPSFVSTFPGFGTFRQPFAQQNAAGFSAHASKPLWNAGRINSTVRAAELRSFASVESSEWTESQLLMAVAEAYVAVLQTTQTLRAADRLLEVARVRAHETTQQAQQQQATQQQAQAARVSVAHAERDLLKAQSAHNQAAANYNLVLGRRLDCHVELSELAIPLMPHCLDYLTKTAKQTRPDVNELHQRVDASLHESSAWLAARYPELRVEVGFDYEENRYQSPEGVALAGLYLDWQALDGGKKHQSALASTARAAALRAQYRYLLEQIAIEVHQAWNLRSEALAEENAARESLDYTGVRHDQALRRQEQGVTLASEATAAHAEMAEAEARFVIAQTERALSQLRLRFVSGLLRDECRRLCGRQ